MCLYPFLRPKQKNIEKFETKCYNDHYERVIILKKRLIFTVIFVLLIMNFSVYGETLPDEKIEYTQSIGDLFAKGTTGEFYLTDSDNNILGGPHAVISDYSGFPYAENSDGRKVLYDLDGSVIASLSKGESAVPPDKGLYAVMRDSDNGNFAECRIFELYDYETRELIHTFDGTIMYYLELQHEKMFIEKDGKYAVCDKYGNFFTDYIYDDVIKRFNPDYEPFPKAYAIVMEDGEEKYIDLNLNEIDIDNYNGGQFITNSYHMKGIDGLTDYKNYYNLESGKKHALYDLDNDSFLIPYQSEYTFFSMSDKYVITHSEDRRECGVVDLSGNVIIPFKEQQLLFTEDGLISYYYYDGETVHEGILNPETLETEETPLEGNGYFYKVIGETDEEDIAYGTIVYEGRRAADISGDDLKEFVNTFWNFGYERVISPASEYPGDNYYIKLWNRDRTKSTVIYPSGGVIKGTFGSPAEFRGDVRQNYVWYLPCVGNGRNALYSAEQKIWHEYLDKTREIKDEEIPEEPTENLLPRGFSDWAEPEMKEAAALNLMVYDLTDKYTENITRKDFCKLAYRLIATDADPLSDSRMGLWSAIETVIDERGLREKYNSTSFSDCPDDMYVKFLAAADIVNGIGDGTFEPERTITREEAAAVLCRTAKFLNKEIPDSVYNDDEPYADKNLISDRAAHSVLVMRDTGIMKGMNNGNFDPKGNYTVEQAIATMLRLYKAS